MKKSPAFTLIELLTAMAVLTIILVLMVQVINGVLRATQMQSQQMDSVTAARRAIDVIEADLKNAVVGENAAILTSDGSGDSLASFLTSRRGASGTVGHRFLAVSYSTNTDNHLVRSYGSAHFDTQDLLTAATNSTTTSELLAKGILAIQFRAVGDGTNTYAFGTAPSDNWSSNTYNGFTVPSGYTALITHAPTFAAGLTNRTRGIEIWITAVDDQNYDILESANLLATVKGLLGTDPLAWRGAIDGAAIPGQAKSAIRVLNKTIPLR